MVNLLKEVAGPRSMQEVNVVVSAYDRRVYKNKQDEVVSHFLEARLHPSDHRAPGQKSLALVSKRDPKSPTGFNNSTSYTRSQFEAIVAAAGDNVTDLTTKEGAVIGKIYGVKADLMTSPGEGLIVNTKTLKPSELSVQPTAEGKDIRTQVFESQRAAAAADKAAKAAAEQAPSTEAPKEAEAPAAEQAAAEPELG